MRIDVESKKPRRRLKRSKRSLGDNAINYCSYDAESRGLRTPRRRVWSALAARCRHSKIPPFNPPAFFLPRCIFFLFCFAMPFIVCLSLMWYRDAIILSRFISRTSLYSGARHESTLGVCSILFARVGTRYIAIFGPLIGLAYYPPTNPILLSLVSLASFVRSGAYLQRVGSLCIYKVPLFSSANIEVPFFLDACTIAPNQNTPHSPQSDSSPKNKSSKK